MGISQTTINRIGYTFLGLANNLAYVIMLSAAFDLLKITSTPNVEPVAESQTPVVIINNGTSDQANATTAGSDLAQNNQTTFCNKHSTSVILLADSIPSLLIKIFYPWFLVGVRPASKACAVVAFSASAFLMTGLSPHPWLIFVGVACASITAGLGETSFLSISSNYGDGALIGWSTGTGIAGFVGSIAYASLRMALPVQTIMIYMLTAPLVLMVSYFLVLKPIVGGDQTENLLANGNGSPVSMGCNSKQREAMESRRISSIGLIGDQERLLGPTKSHRIADYGGAPSRDQHHDHDHGNKLTNPLGRLAAHEPQRLDLRSKLQILPSLIKYFVPLFLVYFAEYFINQGLLELFYFPEVISLSHAAQYRWFQVSYQFGVLISRASLDFFRIRWLWAMGVLQCLNAAVFYAHAAQALDLDNFYLVVAIVVYEGLLGGFSYVNTFHRIKNETGSGVRREFCISTVTMAESIGIVLAGLISSPVHDSLCQLYG